MDGFALVGWLARSWFLAGSIASSLMAAREDIEWLNYKLHKIRFEQMVINVE